MELTGKVAKDAVYSKIVYVRSYIVILRALQFVLKTSPLVVIVTFLRVLVNKNHHRINI